MNEKYTPEMANLAVRSIPFHELDGNTYIRKGLYLTHLLSFTIEVQKCVSGIEQGAILKISSQAGGPSTQ